MPTLNSKFSGYNLQTSTRRAAQKQESCYEELSNTEYFLWVGKRTPWEPQPHQEGWASDTGRDLESGSCVGPKLPHTKAFA